ncbi:MAG: Thiazole synthase [Planctomycetes bacterium]|nr:Thiazole synthase [Planctomycetota bacterium]
MSSAPAGPDARLVVGPFSFASRIVLGTGKYADFGTMERALAASGSELVTVAIRRLPPAGSGPSLWDHIDRRRITILPNTAGCFTADEAVRTARLARELCGHALLKLEVLYDQASLLPEPLETLKALDVLSREGFTTMVYCGDDPVLAKRYEERGAAAVMPLGSAIGSGLGILNPRNVEFIVRHAKVPVLVDAGLGVPSDVARAMELGADGVIVNTAIALAKDPVAMAEGMRLACEAGRLGFLAGRMPAREGGAPSSPVAGVIGTPQAKA